MAKYSIRASSNAYSSIPSRGAEIAFRLDDITLAAWIKCAPVYVGGQAEDDFLIAYPNHQTATQFRVRGDTGVIDFYIGAEPTIAHVIGSTCVADNEWHFVVATCDRSSATGMKLYVDGVEEETTGTPDPTPFIETDLVKTNLGLYYAMILYNPNDTVGPLADQFQFYRTALTLEQIRYLYNGGLGRAIDETWFASVSDGWYTEFNGGSGTIVLGRLCVGGSWSNYNLTGPASQWEAGGVPFPSEETVFTNRVREPFDNIQRGRR